MYFLFPASNKKDWRLKIKSHLGGRSLLNHQVFLSLLPRPGRRSPKKILSLPFVLQVHTISTSRKKKNYYVLDQSLRIGSFKLRCIYRSWVPSPFTLIEKTICVISRDRGPAVSPERLYRNRAITGGYRQLFRQF